MGRGEGLQEGGERIDVVIAGDPVAPGREGSGAVAAGGDLVVAATRQLWLRTNGKSMSVRNLP